VNGIAQTAACAVRGVGPAIGGLVWSWSLNVGLGWFHSVFVGLGGVCFLAYWLALKIPKEYDSRTVRS
jgi:hypothetical protein